MSSQNPFKKYIIICLILFPLFWFLFPRTGHSYDTYCWMEWSKYIFKNGLGMIYNSFTDYLPLYHYMLKFYVSLQGSEEEVLKNIFYLKMITVIFHFITGYFIFLLIRKEKENDDKNLINVLLFYLLNIAVLYNGLVWGQVDIILTCFIFISCYYAFKHKPFLSLLFILLALNFKLHAIIFVPVIGLLLLPHLIHSFSLKKVILWIVVLGTLQYLIVLPFINGGTIDHLIGVVKGSVGKFPVISANAFNMWDLLVEGNLALLHDDATALGVSYKNWGLLLFCSASALALFPQFKLIYRSIKTKMPLQLSLEKVLLICSLIPMLFFYFNTQMHERYSHPALAFLITYCILQKKPFLAFVACAAYLLNLEAVMRYLQLPKYSTLLFDRDFISLLWLFTIVRVYLELYELKFRKPVLAEA